MCVYFSSLLKRKLLVYSLLHMATACDLVRPDRRPGKPPFSVHSMLKTQLDPCKSGNLKLEMPGWLLGSYMSTSPLLMSWKPVYHPVHSCPLPSLVVLPEDSHQFTVSYSPLIAQMSETSCASGKETPSEQEPLSGCSSHAFQASLLCR